MRQPISYLHGNLVFGSRPRDVWAVYRLGHGSAFLEGLTGVGGTAGVDFSVLRVARPWSTARYALGVEATTDVQHAHRRELTRYLRSQREQLDRWQSHVPETYLTVRLTREGRWRWRPGAPTISGRRLERLVEAEAQLGDRLRDRVEIAAASTRELQWLVRRSFCRGLGDPLVDEHFEPQALVVEDGGELRYRPLEVDVLRLFDASVEMQARALRIESELGVSRQAFLCLGSLPDAAEFPSLEADLLFAPLETLDFSVDAVLAARRVRPDLLRATVSLCVSAPTEDELEEHVARLRREYRSMSLHRPLGDQLRLFLAHLPGQPCRVRAYDGYVGAERLGALLPEATHAVGSGPGPCIGKTLTGVPRPVLYEPSGPALFVGTHGSGKSVALQLVSYQALLRGAAVVTVDPRGTNGLDRLPGMAEHTSKVTLSPSDRGALDPLRTAPPDLREDLAVDFLLGLLPTELALAAGPAVRRVVGEAARRIGAGCLDVLEGLAARGGEAAEAAEALGRLAETGVASVGFASGWHGTAGLPTAQCTLLQAPALSPADDWVGAGDSARRAVMHLLAAQGLALAEAHPQGRVILVLDDADVLASGESLLNRLVGYAKAAAVTILAALPAGAAEANLGDAMDSVFCFGVDSDRDVSRVSSLLGLDANGWLGTTLRSLGPGRCVMRDPVGRTGAIQVDPLSADLSAALLCKPGAHPGGLPDRRR